MTQGKKTRIRVRSSLSTYVGELLIPPMRNRISDVLNDESVLFLNLTDVVRAILLFYMSPLWSTLLGVLVLKEQLTVNRFFVFECRD